MALKTPALRTSFSPHVCAFATEQGVSDLLHPLLDMTQRVFSDADRIETLLEDDAELGKNDRDTSFLKSRPVPWR